MLLLRDLPKYETLLAYSKRYRHVNPGAVESFLNLLRTASDMLDAAEQFFAGHGTSQGRFTVLCLLNRNPDEALNPCDLALRSGVTRATMTGLLQGLEAEGLIKRTASLDDKRMFQVELTTKGRRFLDIVLPDFFRRVGDVMSGLNEKDQKKLLGLLEKVQEGTDSMIPAADKVAA